MTTLATINDLALDEGLFQWPLYRGTEPRMVKIYGFGPKWDDYKAMVAKLQGSPAKIKIRGTRKPGGDEGVLNREIAEVYVVRATRINEVSVELQCFDSRLLLNRAVGDMDFNMTFGDGFLNGTEFETYEDAIRAYCARFPFITERLASNAFAGIPANRKLESNAHLSAMVSGDPLGYLCDRAGCDPVVGLDGKWYFASREDATAGWFAGYDDYNWLVRPGFLALETVVMQRPRSIISYYWERHCIRAEGVDDQSTASTYGPPETQVEFAQRYLYEGVYYTLGELLDVLLLPTVTDAQIAKAFLSDSAQGSPLHPLDTFARKVAWAVIRRDWRRLWRITFPNGGNTGGWDSWQFGKLNSDGSVDPVGVECPYVEFKRVISAGPGETIEGQPWTFNRESPAPFKAIWDDGPESAIVRLVPTADSLDDLMPPMPGALAVTRKGDSALPSDALVIAARDELDNTEGVSNTIRNCTIFGREDISKARFVNSFRLFVYLVARRFMPNDKTRWHKESASGFGDGDIEQVELPPGAEVTCYRTFVGGDAPAPASDGLGAVLNPTELSDDATRRADVWKTTHSLSAEGRGRADTLALAGVDRLVNGPVVDAMLTIEGVETYTEISVGNMGDDEQRAKIARKREAARGVNVQGVPVV